jgi:hypothetical protein
MMIPASAAAMEGVRSVQNNEFPHSFHAQYTRLLLVSSKQGNAPDARSMALKKISKLVHFIVFSASPGACVPAMQVGLTPPAGTAAALAAAQKPYGSTGTGTTADKTLMVLPGAVDVMVLMQVRKASLQRFIIFVCINLARAPLYLKHR